MSFSPSITARRVACAYAIFAAMWIASSDALTARLFHNIDHVLWFGMAKGAAFVVVTSLLLWAVLRRQFVQLERMGQETARATASEAVAHRLLKALCDITPSAVVILDEADRLVAFNPEAERLTGLQRHTVSTLQELHVASRRAGCEWLPASLDSARNRQPDASRHVSPANSQVLRTSHAVLEVVCGPLLPELGQGQARYLVARDITDITHAREKLIASERDYRQLFDANPHPMWVFDLESWMFLAVNDAAVQKYGYTKEEFLAMRISDIRDESEQVRLTGHLDEIERDALRGFKNSGIWSHRTKDGRAIHVQILSNELAMGDRPARLVLARDVTESLRVEQALRASREQLEELTQRLLSQEQELSRRMAQRLHDDIGQSLYASHLLIETAMAASLETVRNDHLNKAMRELENANQSLRSVIQELVPPGLKEHSLATALKSEVADRLLPATASILVHDHTDGQRWPWPVEHGAYMIAREAIMNAVRHSSATRIEISLRRLQDALLVDVTDNGCGIDKQLLQGRPGHLGITGMRERAANLGATLSLESSPSHGTTVTLTIPLDPP